ncbi:MAG: calcium/sodium antiporter [bacterium]|nr:calcium/sodium antiporter [bacterium]
MNFYGFISNLSQPTATIINVLLLALGFTMLAKGADWFVEGASGIAVKLKIPQIIIGLTIVAMGTSAPEAAVSISSALKGNADIAIGNVVGSNILNILIILGISAIITPLIIARSTQIIDIPVMISATVLLLLLGLDGSIGILDGIIFLAAFISYMIYLFLVARKKIEQPVSTGGEMSLVKSIVFTIIGLSVIIIGSNISIESATFLALKMGVSERFIGLTVVALGTSLPELFTSVTAAYKKNADIAIGNIVGSNIFNILFILGITSLLHTVPFVNKFRIDTIIAVGSALLLLLCCIIFKKLNRISGIIMLLSYVSYFIYLLYK